MSLWNVQNVLIMNKSDCFLEKKPFLFFLSQNVATLDTMKKANPSSHSYIPLMLGYFGVGKAILWCLLALQNRRNPILVIFNVSQNVL